MTRELPDLDLFLGICREEDHLEAQLEDGSSVCGICGLVMGDPTSISRWADFPSVPLRSAYRRSSYFRELLSQWAGTDPDIDEDDERKIANRAYEMLAKEGLPDDTMLQRRFYRKVLRSLGRKFDKYYERHAKITWRVAGRRVPCPTRQQLERLMDIFRRFEKAARETYSGWFNYNFVIRILLYVADAEDAAAGVPLSHFMDYASHFGQVQSRARFRQYSHRVARVLRHMGHDIVAKPLFSVDGEAKKP